jgi:hypothetical protein
MVYSFTVYCFEIWFEEARVQGDGFRVIGERLGRQPHTHQQPDVNYIQVLEKVDFA